jgi:peptidoglycan hydrolase-like protein with peptidoglycan-binding domain
MRAVTARAYEDGFVGRLSAYWTFVLRQLRRRPLDSIAAAVAAIAVIAIVINALFMQSGPHPAPIFANRAPAPPAAQLKAPAGNARVEPSPNARARPNVIADIQRELARRGFYDGAADGVYGPKTDAAIRDFERAAGLRASAEPNDALLAAISRSKVKAEAASPTRNDPIAALLAANPRVLAVQRALTDFGYGPLKPTGVYDPDTRAAVERFERARKRPVTGHISEQLVRDLAAMTGRPLE